MKTINLNTGSSSTKIMIGESISNLEKYIPSYSIIITDKNVFKNYKNIISKYRNIQVKVGESSKSLTTIEYIISKLISYGAERNTFLVGFGGGVVTDITGFVASVFYRGLNFGYVSTTLLGQVDASIGGKNGIDFNSIKNVIGTINQPQFILSDLNTLQTLKPLELKNGSIEALKTALIADNKLFKIITENVNHIVDGDKEILEKIVYECAKIKSGIVANDEKENGLRRILNFGHTFGHAIESLTGISHGQAVSEGMLIATKLSTVLSGLSTKEFVIINNTIKSINFDKKVEYSNNEIFDFLIKDKKRYNDKIKLCLLKGIGIPIIKEIEIKELRKIYYDLC